MKQTRSQSRRFSYFGRQIGLDLLIENSPFENCKRVAYDIIIDNTVVFGESSQTPQGDYQRKELVLVHLVLVGHLLHHLVESTNQFVQDSAPGKVTPCVN